MTNFRHLPPRQAEQGLPVPSVDRTTIGVIIRELLRYYSKLPTG